MLNDSPMRRSRPVWLTVSALWVTLWPLWTPAMAVDLSVAVRDLTGRPLADAVVFVEPQGAAPHRPEQTARAKIDQIDKEFVPLVSIVQTGTEVFFPNSDNIRHSIYSFSSAKVFTAMLYSGKQAPPVVFDNPGLVVLGCNIHDAMVAWVVVVDTPYFAKTGVDGAVLIKGLDPGDYRLNVWYPAVTFKPHLEPIHVATTAQRHDVMLDTGDSPLPALKARTRAAP